MVLQTLKNIRSITKPGMHGDGGGLYLRVTKSGTKSWIYRFQLSGKRREMGLGAGNSMWYFFKKSSSSITVIFRFLGMTTGAIAGIGIVGTGRRGSFLPRSVVSAVGASRSGSGPGWPRQ